MTSKSRRRRIAAILRYAVLTAWAVVAFFPIYWMVSTSFKPDTQWFAWPPVYFPHPPTLSNYLNVWFGAEEYAATQYAISLAEAADLADELDHHRRHLDAALGAVRVGASPTASRATGSCPRRACSSC